MHPECRALPDATTTTTKPDPELVLLPLPLAARTAACLVVGRTFFPYLATDNGERKREKERERERERERGLPRVGCRAFRVVDRIVEAKVVGTRGLR
jgi:hypothetical protein